MGMARVLAQAVLQRRRVKRGQRPLCRARTVQLFKAYKDRYWTFKRDFQAGYRYARDQVLRGLTLIQMLFPAGGIMPLSVGALSTLSVQAKLE